MESWILRKNGGVKWTQSQDLEKSQRDAIIYLINPRKRDGRLIHILDILFGSRYLYSALSSMVTYVKLPRREAVIGDSGIGYIISILRG